MHKLYFSEIEPGQRSTPLAAACGVGGPPQASNLNRGADGLIAGAKNLWEAVDSPAEADVAVYSCNYGAAGPADAFAQEATAAGLPCLMFDLSDDSTPPSTTAGTVYRCSIDRSRQAANERAMPPICPNAFAEEDTLPRRKGERPKVTFCGYLAPWRKRVVFQALGRTDKIAGHSTRARTLARLERSRSVETEFVSRRGYWGNALRFRNDPARVDRVRQQYLDNLRAGDYVVCVRGAGNFSYRFYETLSAGRIPLLVDTDCVLPLPERIDWERHALIVPESDLNRIGDRVADHFHALSADDHAELQEANRRLFHTLLSPLAFMQQVVQAAVDDGSTPSP